MHHIGAPGGHLLALADTVGRSRNKREHVPAVVSRCLPPPTHPNSIRFLTPNRAKPRCCVRARRLPPPATLPFPFRHPNPATLPFRRRGRDGEAGR